MTSSKYTNHLLLAGSNLNGQAIIKEELQGKDFPSRLSFTTTSTAEETLDYLQDSSLTTFNFPCLLLLDAKLLELDPEWSLLSNIQSTYPGLPIILVSPNDSATTINSAYQRGVQAVVIKSQDYQDWATKLKALIDFWTNTASLPRLFV